MWATQVGLLSRDLYPAIVTLAQGGASAYRYRYGLNDRHRATASNAMWQAHYTMLDTLIVDANGTTTPPWHTIIIDEYSGYLLFLGAPSGLYTSVWRKKASDWPVCGNPEMLYVDHGSDLTSENFDQAAAALWLQIIYSAVARPQMPDSIEDFNLLRVIASKPRTLRRDGIHFQRPRHQPWMCA
jgi:putative transposase